jgi:DNA-binding transcriptional regulator YiaG
MAKKAKRFPQGDELVQIRKKEALNQLEFWQRFGITQSGGSRYESGRSVPNPAKILMRLYLDGTITTEDLAGARKGAGVPSVEKTA